jgi:hypothetical protein
MNRQARYQAGSAIVIFVLGVGFGNSALHTWADDRLGSALCGIFSITLFIGAWRIWNSDD